MIASLSISTTNKKLIMIITNYDYYTYEKNIYNIKFYDKKTLNLFLTNILDLDFTLIDYIYI